MNRRLVVGLAVLFVLAGCGGSPAASTTPVASPSADPAQAYVSSVNKLCDALLPKVLDVMHGGHTGTYPVTTFFAELPAHSALEAQFDKDLAGIPVPASAAKAHRALDDYIAFANKIDAARLQAARKGQAAFDAVITQQNATASSDPTIAARTAAGFADTCNAR